MLLKTHIMFCPLGGVKKRYQLIDYYFLMSRFNLYLNHRDCQMVHHWYNKLFTLLAASYCRARCWRQQDRLARARWNTCECVNDWAPFGKIIPSKKACERNPRGKYQKKLICENNLDKKAALSHYFLIHFPQTKITLFIFVNNWVIRENKSFLTVEPYSRVTCFSQIKLQYFFRKYIFICTIYTLLMQLISENLYKTC